MFLGDARVETKHYIIFNPTAGSRNAQSRLQAQLDALSPTPYTVLITRDAGDATRLVRQVRAQETGPLRFYAAGGDGTLGEVATALIHTPDAAVGVWSCGSGNDYARMYGGVDRFLDLKQQTTAPTVLVDMIKVNGYAAINVVNLGLEAHAAATMMRFRNTPVMGGKRAYWVGAISAVTKHLNTNCTIHLDGQPFYEGNLLTASFASGQYIGGGFHCAPKAINDDGLMDVCAIRPVSRRRLVSLLGTYQKGGHLDSPDFEGIRLYRRAKRAAISCQKETVLCLDGEIIKGKQFDLELLPLSVRFILPGA